MDTKIDVLHKKRVFAHLRSSPRDACEPLFVGRAFSVSTTCSGHRVFAHLRPGNLLRDFHQRFGVIS